MLFITALTFRPKLADEATRQRAFCYEVLVPYTDPVESRTKRVPNETRHALIVQVWATDPARAKEYARERFREHRIRARTSQMASEGPVPLRILRSD